MIALLDGWAEATAPRIVAWVAQQVAPEHREWVHALGNELPESGNGWAQLRWALSSVPLLWSFRGMPAFQPRALGQWIGAFTTGTLLLVAVVLQVFLVPMFRLLLESLDGHLPWPALVAGVALHPIVLGVLGSGLTVYVWWQQPVVQARGVAPWLRRWPVLSAANLYLIVGIMGLSTTFVSFAELGTERMVARSRLASPVRPRVKKSLAETARFHMVPELAKHSFMRGDFANAQQEATEALDAAPRFTDDASYGQAVHDGNMVLGRLALRTGDRAEAIRRLKAAGSSPGAPVLNSFGPDMSLARDLLAVGEREAVLAYFEQCRVFWGTGRRHGADLSAWAADVRAGRSPRFGANSAY